VIKILTPPRNHKMIGNDYLYELPIEILQGINEVKLIIWKWMNISLLCPIVCLFAFYFKMVCSFL
jgi:hypothetical protein